MDTEQVPGHEQLVWEQQQRSRLLLVLCRWLCFLSFVFQVSTINRLLAASPGLVDACDEDGYTPLHRAAYGGHMEAVSALLAAGAKVNRQTMDGWTPLHSACRWSRVAVASLLLKHGAELNGQTKGGLTPLHLAASQSSSFKADSALTLELLLSQRQLKLGLRSSGGETASEVARGSGLNYFLFEMAEECVSVAPMQWAVSQVFAARPHAGSPRAEPSHSPSWALVDFILKTGLKCNDQKNPCLCFLRFLSILIFLLHLKQVSLTDFFHLRNIAQIRSILSQGDAEKLVHAFVTSRLDYCNSLLSGCPNYLLTNLQLVQNAAARILTRITKRDQISLVLASLYWLPVKSRIDFRILLLTYKALNGLSPLYLQDLIVPYIPKRTLRSQSAGLLVVPRIHKSRLGGRAFSYQAALLWNQLATWVREVDTTSV